MIFRYFKLYGLSVVILVGGIAFSIAAFFWLRHYEMQAAHKEFSKVLEKYTVSIEHTLLENTHTLNALAAFYYSQEGLSHRSFKTFTETVLQHHKEIRALGWIPEVFHEERETFEQKIRAEGLQSFSITQVGTEGTMVAAEEREVYYPIAYISPLEGNVEASGFDVGSEQKRLEALQKAKNAKSKMVTAPVKMVVDEERQTAILIYYPVFGDPVHEREFFGVFLSIVRLNDLVLMAINKVAPRCEGVELTITDFDTEESDKVLFHQPCMCGADEVHEIDYERTVTFAGRQWHISGHATEMFTSRFMTHYPWMILSVSLLLSFLLSVLHYILARRHAFLQETNEELRRFQQVAIGREERIVELKRELDDLKAEKGSES